MPKPRVMTKCPANAYAGSDERIIEFTFPGTKGDVYAQGGLIEFRTLNGVGYVEVYGCDMDVVVNGFRTGDGDPVQSDRRSDGKIWSHLWPTEPGSYWFYGDPFGAKDVRHQSVRSYFVRVLQISKGLAFICEGHFLYKQEASPGFWTPAETPEDPTKENVINV